MSIPPNFPSPRTTFTHQPSTTTLPIQPNLSTNCNHQRHTSSPSLRSRCQCIINTPHTLICTRRSRTISPIPQCTVGITVILHTRHPLLSFILRSSITPSACHHMLTTLVPPVCSVPFLLYFLPHPPATRIPQPRLRSPLVTKIKSHSIPPRLFTSVRLASHRPPSPKRINSI